MAVELYVGSVGSGKSYHALERGVSKVNAFSNNIVVANFPITFKTKKEKSNWLFLEDFTPEDLIKISFERGFYGKEGFALIIIDEAGSWFNSRDWQIDGDKRKEWIKFFSQSRKFGYDVVMIAQDVRMLDRQIRSLAEYHVKHVKLRNYTWLKWVPLPLFAHVNYWQGGAFKGNVQISLLKPWIAKRYNTMRLFKMSDEVKEMAESYGVTVQESDSETMEGGNLKGGFPTWFGTLSQRLKKVVSR